MSMNDLEGRSDIELLIDTFYEKVKVDPDIGFFFKEIVPVNWESHMPLMYDFWETTLFHKAAYKGNVLQKHVLLNSKAIMTKAHFDRWLELFQKTVDELFKGSNAELAKTRALSIATVMQIKLHDTSAD